MSQDSYEIADSANGAASADTATVTEKLAPASAPAEPSPQTGRVLVACPNCKTELSVRRKSSGDGIRCPHCRQKFPRPVGLDAPSPPVYDGKPTAPPSVRAPAIAAPAASQPARANDWRLEELVELAVSDQELRAGHDLLQSQLKETQAERNVIAEQLKRATLELSAIRAQLGPVALADVQPLALQRDALGAEVRRLRDLNSAFAAERSKHEQSVSQLEAQVRELSPLRAEREALDTRTKSLEAELARLNEEQRNALATTERLTRQVAELEQTLAIQRQEFVVELERSRDALDSAYETHCAEHDTLAALRQALAVERDTLCAERDALSVELERSRQTLASAQETHGAERDTLAAERAALTAERDALTAELDRSRQSLASAHESHGAERDNLTAERDSLTAELERTRQALASAHESHGAERDNLTAERDSLIVELERTRQALVSAHDSHGAERDNLTAERDSLTAELERSRQTLAFAHDTHNAERERLTADREKLGAELTALGSECDRLREANRSAELLCMNLGSKNAEFTKAHEQLVAEYAARFEAERVKHEALANEVLRYRADCQDTDQAIHELIETSVGEPALPAPVHQDLEAVRAQSDDLKRGLAESERINQMLADSLNSIGIQVTFPGKPRTPASVSS
jgi:chromosome segregation ATPase/DNA-directed RNA polymerase subunit RPC12/RpoP